jgi:hypothetical protein
MSIAGGSSCQVGLTFTATGVGNYTGSATIPSSGPNSPQTVNLSGTGLQASLNLSPSLAFSNTPGRWDQPNQDRETDKSELGWG